LLLVADFLSRPSPFVSLSSVSPAVPANLFPIPLSYHHIAQQQQLCLSIPPLQANPSLSVTSIPLSPTLSLLGDVSTSTFRPLIPLSCRQQIFKHVHSLGHPGIRATRRLISSRFLWNSMTRDVNQWTRQCIPCQKVKIHVHTRSSPSSIPIPYPSLCPHSH
jgi:hypothetical protein